MKKIWNKIFRILAFIVVIPLIGTMFVKPQRETWKREETDTSVIDECFAVMVKEDIGSFYYNPESFTELVMYRMIPEDMVFSDSEDYIAGTDSANDPEQEYLKALSIVCRSNIVSAWEAAQGPEILEYDRMRLGAVSFYKICSDIQLGAENNLQKSAQVKMKEIKKAADATKGAVITEDNNVVAAPFFTTSASDMLVSEAGSGVGFSLNYSYELAKQGMDFYEILKYFFGDIKVNIYG